MLPSCTPGAACCCAEARGQLVAGQLNPGAEHGRQLAPGDGLQQFGPPGLVISGAAQKLSLVFGAEAAANHAGAPRQAEVVVEEDSFDAVGLDQPECGAVFLGGWTVQRRTGVRCAIRPRAEFPVSGRSERHVAGGCPQRIARMPQRQVDQVGGHAQLFGPPAPWPRLLQGIVPVTVEEAGEPDVGYARTMDKLQQSGIGLEHVGRDREMVLSLDGRCLLGHRRGQPCAGRDRPARL